MGRTFSYILLFLLIMHVQPVHADEPSDASFRTETLRQLASSLRLSPYTIPDGFSCKTIDGSCLSLMKEDEVITHIGYHLFSEESHTASRSDVLSFIERIFLQLMYPGDRTQSWLLRDYRLKFEKGALSNVKDILPNDVFSLSILAGKKANAIWSRDDKPFIDFAFPMEYSLLSGEDKVEAENNLANDIIRSPSQVDFRPSQDNQLFTETNQSNYLTKKGNSYIDQRLNSDTYYQLIDGRPTLLLDVTFPAESSANLFLDAATGGDYKLHFTQILYGFKQKQFTVPLWQWLNFCQIQGCKLYFGVEEVSSSEVRASVIAVNELVGYNHVMFVKIPFKVVDDRVGEIEAQIHAYVPMHNVTNLFESYKTKRNNNANKY